MPLPCSSMHKQIALPVKLTSASLCAGADPDLVSIDQVPDGADPNGLLQIYVDQADPQSDLQPRVATFAPNPGTKATQQLKDVIAQWTLDVIDAGRGQVRADSCVHDPADWDVKGFVCKLLVTGKMLGICIGPGVPIMSYSMLRSPAQTDQ